MRTQLDTALLALLVGTDEQRRRFGQTLYHFYKTLVFWMAKDRTFLQITGAWSAGAATIFDTLAATLQDLGKPERDDRLRAFVAQVLDQLAGDLERGDNMLVPFLRWMETLFPELTKMIQEENADSRIYDVELARELANLFTTVTDADRQVTVERLRDSADRIL